MIFVRDLKYVKVSKIDRKEKYTKCLLQTSEKKQDGTWENSSWWSTLVGKAHQSVLEENEKITVVSGKLTNVYNKEKKQSYLNFTVFEIMQEAKEPVNDDFSFGANAFEDFQNIEDDDSVPWK